MPIRQRFLCTGHSSLVTRPALLLACSLSLVALLLSSCVAPWAPRPPWLPPDPTARPTGPSPTSPTGPVPSAPPAGATDLALTDDGVTVFPGPVYYSGDVLTFDIRPENIGDLDPQGIEVHIYHGVAHPDYLVAAGRTGFYSFDGVPRARIIWSWDTAGLEGEQTLIAWLDPEDVIQDGDEDPHNNLVTFTVYLQPAAELPPSEVSADWISTTLPCCVVHYLDNSSAGRDVATIAAVAQESVDDVAARMGVALPRQLRLYLIERVIGHGGYAYDAVVLSYLDRHYAGSDLATVVRHEATHVLDGQLVRGAYPPTMLREGLATYMAGGHFKPEPIPQRTAALLELDYYIPLAQLVTDFYHHQHEVGYLEAAGLTAYLIETYGWDRFCDFYASFPNDRRPLAEQLDTMLAGTYGRGLAETEAGFLDWLRALPPDPGQVRDLRATVDLFDTLRRYQAALDPGAYFMSGFFANPTEARQRGIVADFVRRPREPENVALEALLIAAREELAAERFDEGEALIAAVNRVLETGDWSRAPAADYMAIVQAVAAAGYEAQWIELDGDTARVGAIAVWPELEVLTLRRVGESWR